MIGLVLSKDCPEFNGRCVSTRRAFECDRRQRRTLAAAAQYPQDEADQILDKVSAFD